MMLVRVLHVDLPKLPRQTEMTIIQVSGRKEDLIVSLVSFE